MMGKKNYPFTHNQRQPVILLTSLFTLGLLLVLVQTFAGSAAAANTTSSPLQEAPAQIITQTLTAAEMNPATKAFQNNFCLMSS